MGARRRSAARASNGTIVKAPVLSSLTTAEGEYGPWLVITLVLEVDERVGEPGIAPEQRKRSARDRPLM